MVDAVIKEEIKAKLRNLTGKTNVLILKRGNAAIEEIVKIAKAMGREKVLIQDQGGWMTYRQIANKKGLMCIDIKTDYGLTNIDDLEKKADGKSIFVVNSMPGYYADDDIENIAKICSKKHCLLANDVSGSIGLNLSKYGDIIFGSFNKWKPIDLGLAGFIAFDDKLLSNAEINPETQALIQKYFDLTLYFKDFEEYLLKDKDLEKLYEKMKNVEQRHDFLKKMHDKIKKDLKDFKIIHPNKQGINVIVKFDNDEEKNKIIKYCEDNKLEYTECPRFIRVNEKAICIEVKRL